MSLRHVAILCVAPIAMSAMALPAQAASPVSPAFEKAMLAELSPETRAEVKKRATGGPTVSGVIATMLLNNYQAAGPRKPGEALSVTAVDFSRGVAVIRRAPNVFEVQRFDPKTLKLLR